MIIPAVYLGTTPTTWAASGGNAAAGVLIALFVIGGVLLLVFFLAALVSIVRSPRLTSGAKLVWGVGCLILQFFGPLLWFLWGRHQDFGGPGGSAGPASTRP